VKEVFKEVCEEIKGSLWLQMLFSFIGLLFIALITVAIVY
jgi:hypothetical protein